MTLKLNVQSPSCLQGPDRQTDEGCYIIIIQSEYGHIKIYKQSYFLKIFINIAIDGQSIIYAFARHFEHVYLLSLYQIVSHQCRQLSNIEFWINMYHRFIPNDRKSNVSDNCYINNCDTSSPHNFLRGVCCVDETHCSSYFHTLSKNQQKNFQ
jgi:hypothetical protein